MPVLRTRLAVALVSAAVVGLELALMRSLALRHWHHFACMVIGVALLGFGAGGTALALAHRRIAGRQCAWLGRLALAFGASVLPARWLALSVALDVPLLPWQWEQLGWVLVLELVLVVPFFLAAAFTGVVLTDRPERVGGHYAANLMGSGVGGLAAVLLMNVLSLEGIVAVQAVMALAAGAMVLPWRPAWKSAGALAAATAATVLADFLPQAAEVSQYKFLPQALATPDSKVIYRAEGPMGRIDVVEGPAIHFAPGLSLAYDGPLPPHVLLLIDGEASSAVYDCRGANDWAFMDWTTKAAPYALRDRPEVLIIGAGGGSDIGLALYHNARKVTALEANPQVVAAMTGPLASRGGRIYAAEGVRVLPLEARAMLAACHRKFDVIELPELEGFGASGAGLLAAQESYLHTVEAVGLMLDRLTADGILCLTRWARTPPRDSLRLLDTAAAALGRRGLQPKEHLAMIRSWATESVLVLRRPVAPQEAARLREFCRLRLFDLGWLPDMRPGEANRYHVLDRPYDYDGARALLGPQREAFLAEYPFNVAAATDDRPFFGHFFRWRSLPLLWNQLGQRAKAHLEAGYLMLVAAGVQALVLSAVLIVVPLVPRAGAVRAAPGKAAVLGYFAMLGFGFMMLEMGVLQRLILYLGHPVYAAATAISAFLVFAGAGSAVSRLWRASPGRVITWAGGAVVVMAGTAAFGLDALLHATQGASLAARFALATVTIAPLALAMGHMFPTALGQVNQAAPGAVPWAWAVNGVASVLATMAAPLAAMEIGFWRLIVAAMFCYGLAVLAGRRLPRPAVTGSSMAPAA